MLSTVVTTESGLFNNSLTVEAQYSNVYGNGYLDMDCYVAGLMTDENNPICKSVMYKLTADTPSDILVKSISSDGWFMTGMAAWEALTFKPSDITESTINEIGYYETMILKSLKTSVSTDIVKKIFDEQATKDSKKLFSIFKNAIKLDYAYNLDFNKLSTQEQNNIIEEFEKSFSKAFPDIKDTGKAVGIFSDLVKAGETYEEAINNIASYMACSDLSEYMKRVVSDLYNNCDGLDNPTMKTALLNVNSACQSYEMAFNSAMFDLGGQGFSIVFGKVVDEMFDDIVGSNAFTAGALIGQAIGQNVSNILFSTDATCEQYYKMRVMYNFEALLRDVTKKEMANFKSNPTKDNANILFSAVDMLYTQYDISCDLAIEYADIVFTKNLASFFNSNSDKYNQFVSSVNSMKQINEQNYKVTIKESYIYYLEEDYPDVYESLINEIEENKEEVVTIKPVTEIAFPVDSVEWGMEDTGLNNGNAQITPRDATNPQITYTSSDESVVTYGIFGPRVHKPGKAVITATSVSSGLTATLNVTVVEGNGADGVCYEPVMPGEKPEIGDKFIIGDLTYEVIADNEVEIDDCSSSAVSVSVPKYVSYKGYSFKVTSIGRCAFYECNRLTSIEILNGVTLIGESAFESCTYLAGIEIPDSVTSIGNRAFTECIRLTSIRIPDSVIEIGGGIFDNCIRLKYVELSKNISTLDWCGEWSGHTGFFAHCISLESITIPYGIINIGLDTFEYCSSLKNIILPSSVKTISDSAFDHCSNLKNIVIPEGVNYIGNSAFRNTSLENIFVSDNNENYSSIDGVLFNKDKTKLIQYPASKKDTEYSIPNSVTNIESGAFYQCKNLENINIPEGVTSIGRYAFRICSRLKSIDLPDSITSIGACAFEYTPLLENQENIKYIDKWVIDCADNIEIAVIKEGTIGIAKDAFRGYKSLLTNIEIPDSVTYIGDDAFLNCSNLISIKIPDNVTYIGK